MLVVDKMISHPKDNPIASFSLPSKISAHHGQGGWIFFCISSYVFIHIVEQK